MLIDRIRGVCADGTLSQRRLSTGLVQRFMWRSGSQSGCGASGSDLDAFCRCWSFARFAASSIPCRRCRGRVRSRARQVSGLISFVRWTCDEVALIRCKHGSVSHPWIDWVAMLDVLQVRRRHMPGVCMRRIRWHRWLSQTLLSEAWSVISRQ